MAGSFAPRGVKEILIGLPIMAGIFLLATLIEMYHWIGFILLVLLGSYIIGWMVWDEYIKTR